MENEKIDIEQVIEANRSDPLEQRVFRLETAVISMSKAEGEMMDKLKNAHHRIDETNTAVREIKEKMREINTKVDNIGINLAKKDERDKKWRKWLIVIGVIAAAAFVGMFIQDADIRKGIGEIALKVGVGAASAL